MTSRRSFLKGGAAAAATGVVFCSCGLLERAHAQNPNQNPAGRTLPVAVNGKKVRTIDVHAHCYFHEVEPLVGPEIAKRFLPPVNYAANAFIEIQKRLDAMDAQAVDMEVLSVNPYWYGLDRDLAGKVVKLQNEKMAELCAAQPNRFAGFASLTLQAPELAVQELETAVRKQG
ncbi:MAG: amidohydrolase family protein, partial [Enhydrobacter sp.]